MFEFSYDYGQLKTFFANYAPLAQLDRAFGYGPKGQEFESLTARQEQSTVKTVLFLLPLVNRTDFFVFIIILFVLYITHCFLRFFCWLQCKKLQKCDKKLQKGKNGGGENLYKIAYYMQKSDKKVPFFMFFGDFLWLWVICLMDTKMSFYFFLFC